MTRSRRHIVVYQYHWVNTFHDTIEDMRARGTLLGSVSTLFHRMVAKRRDCHTIYSREHIMIMNSV